MMNRWMLSMGLLACAGAFVGCDQKQPETPKPNGTGNATTTAPASATGGTVEAAKAKMTEAQQEVIKKYESLVAGSEKQIADLKAKAASATESAKARIQTAIKPAEAELAKLKTALATAQSEGITDKTKADLESSWAGLQAAWEKALKEAGDVGTAAKDAASDALKSFGK